MTAPVPDSDAKDSHATPRDVQQSLDADSRDARTLLIMDALSRGESYLEIQRKLSCSPNTIANVAKRMQEFETGAVAKLMSVKALDAVDLWYASMQSASKQGKHAPMKDWLTHARVLDPVQQTGESRTQIAVIIGTHDQPIDLPSVQVIDTTDVSGE